MVPYRTPFFLPLLYPTLRWREHTNKKELYLTFDDGPVHGPTEMVLETLNTYNAKATFFCIGDNVRKHPDVFRRIVEDGHTVANHTFNHLNGWRTSAEEYVQNVKLCEEYMRQLKIDSPTTSTSSVEGQSSLPLFRPPYGRITRKQISLLQGYSIVMWDVLSHDYDKSISAETCFKKTAAACRSGSIIVFHDSVKAEKNMQYAFPKLLKEFSEKGFVFKSL